MTDLGNLGVTSGFQIRAPCHQCCRTDRGDALVLGGTIHRHPFHAFFWNDGVMTDLGTLGGTDSRAEDINEGSQVVGISETALGTHAVLWQTRGCD
jgi:probable HAF family extracellular repeat protein